jgi:hypothetical protein
LGENLENSDVFVLKNQALKPPGSILSNYPEAALAKPKGQP